MRSERVHVPLLGAQDDLRPVHGIRRALVPSMSFIYPAILPAARRDHPVKRLTNSQAVFAAAALCSAPVRPIALYNPPAVPHGRTGLVPHPVVTGPMLTVRRNPPPLA